MRNTDDVVMKNQHEQMLKNDGACGGSAKSEIEALFFLRKIKDPTKPTVDITPNPKQINYLNQSTQKHYR